MSDTAGELRLNDLVALITSVQRQVALANDARLMSGIEDFGRGIGALRQVQVELERRIHEHGILQYLDSTLRPMCQARLEAAALARQWQTIKRTRNEINPPFSAQLIAADPDFRAFESEIDAAFERKDEKTATATLRSYFQSISFVFAQVDGSLRKFAMELGTLSPALRAILS